MTLKLFQYLDDNINSAPPKYQSCSFKTVGVVWIQRSKMAVILYTVVPRNSGLQNSGLPLSSGQFLGDQLFYVVIPP